MEQQAAAVQAHIAAASGFQDLVMAMQGLAAARVQRCRHLLDGLHAHARTVTQALAQALALLPEAAATLHTHHSPPRRLVLLLGCEQGFTGGHNERLFQALPTPRADNSLLFVLGERSLRHARQLGLNPVWSAPLLSHLERLQTDTEALRQALDTTLAQHGPLTVELLFAQALPGHAVVVQRQQLLPLDWQPLQPPHGQRPARLQAPLIQLPPQHLLAALADEFLNARLSEALLHAHAAENTARLHAMTQAGDNIAQALERLRADERRWRQEGITSEIVELAAGRIAD